ncbi:MAG: protein kinase [Planctomycetales bacterium]|nr:protein kinase [Planctomycetales bacterium]
MKPLRVKQRLGKYVIERRLGEGGFAVVYQARDSIEGIRVALKIPHPHLLGPEALEDFRREVRLVAQLEHPNILPLKTAQFIDHYFVIVTSKGKMTLDERLSKRLSLETALDYARQILAAVAYAHDNRIVHCDIKPDNFILFDGNRLRLTDFGVARVAQRTLRASGAGTLGYMAPEQAMGRPSFRSDVFSLGLIFYRMFSGRLPEYPFHWPPPSYRQLQQKLNPKQVEVVRRALELSPAKRFANAEQMLSAFQRARNSSGQRGSVTRSTRLTSRSTDWKSLQRRQFQREYGKLLQTRHECSACHGPVSEEMSGCPWCGRRRPVHDGETRFPQHCPRCNRGMKLDWQFCPWCYGPGFEVASDREYGDAAYQARCHNPKCTRKLLMPFMRYCPWCRRKVKRKWKLGQSKKSCPRCGWGVAAGYWSFCPWCCESLRRG